MKYVARASRLHHKQIERALCALPCVDKTTLTFTEVAYSLRMGNYMKNRNWFWGISFIAAAIFIILNKLEYFAGIGLFSLFLTLLLAIIIAKSIMRVNFVGILFPAAFLCIIYAEPLKITNLTPWTVLIAALFGSIGLSLLYKRNRAGFHFHHNGCCRDKNKKFKNTGDCNDENIVTAEVNFSSGIKYVNSPELQKVHIRADFGALKIYFDNAGLNKGGAEINFNASFAGIELYIPETWNVVNSINVSFGSVKEKNKKRESECPVVLLTGNVSFSGVELIYV